MLTDGTIKLGYEDTVFDKHIHEVKKAEKIAEQIMSERDSAA